MSQFTTSNPRLGRRSSVKDKHSTAKPSEVSRHNYRRISSGNRASSVTLPTSRVKTVPPRGTESRIAPLIKNLETLRNLAVGWDGYSAQPPSALALASAHDFLEFVFACEGTLFPQRLAPSVVGGIGITFASGGRSAYIEFYNDGSAFALLSDSVDDENEIIHPVRISRDSFRRLMEEISDYLEK
jgi:hypothetical protein